MLEMCEEESRQTAFGQCQFCRPQFRLIYKTTTIKKYNLYLIFEPKITMFFSRQFRLSLFVLAIVVVMSTNARSSCDDGGHVQPVNAARYDNYRLYRLHLETDEQVQIFVQLEKISDSVVFYGHARNPGQRLTIMVAAHKIADITELLKRFSVEHHILVSGLLCS